MNFCMKRAYANYILCHSTYKLSSHLIMYQGSTSTYISSPHSRNLPKKRRKSVFFPHAKKFFQTYKSALLVLTIIILIGIIVHFIYSFTIGKETNIIRTATFTDEAIEQYHNINLYTYIRNLLS